MQIGQQLGRYEILAKLGEGGMGEVYLARDTRLDRRVALKMLPADVAANPDRMRRFEQEAKAASGLNHPNIITIYEIDRSGTTSFIAAEFIDGSTLRARLGSHPIPVDDVLGVAAQVAGALAAAHANGIVHRDIKPENIIVRSDGIVKVLDFGLAKQTGQDARDDEAATQAPVRTDVGVVMGTATYMSPEQARGQKVDARTDIFSLGVVVYELLTTHLPFEGSSVYEIVGAIVSDREATPLARYTTGLPSELERIVSKALRKNRDERYQTIKDFLLDVESLRQRLAFERTHPATVGHAEPAVASRPRRRWLFIGAAFAALVLVCSTAGFLWWRHVHADTQHQIKSLAVLPLKSLDAEENYLGLGIADATIQRVSQTGRVIVRPTSAVRRYLKADTDALAAAKELGVDSVLDGSFQRDDDRLRVTVNLLRCEDGASLWSDHFDIRMADIFTVQDTVAQQVASRLRLQLDASQRAQLTKRYTSSPVAYESFLKGVYNMEERFRDPMRMTDLAINFFKKAIEADPNFALAHARLAYAYSSRGVFLEASNPALIELAKEEINRADALDPQLADTHLARYQLLYSQFERYDGEGAIREVLMANQLDPNIGHQELAYMYSHLGLEDLAVRELARFEQVDPTSDALRGAKLLQYEAQARYDAYVADRSVQPDPRVEALYLMAAGRLNDAQKLIDDWPRSGANTSPLPQTRALLLAVKGDFQAAEDAIPQVLALHAFKDPLYHHVTYDIACIYALQGKSAEAVKWLKESAVWGFHLYPRYTREPFLDRIRQSPDFIQFVADMKAENDQYRKEFAQDR